MNQNQADLWLKSILPGNYPALRKETWYCTSSVPKAGESTMLVDLSWQLYRDCCLGMQCWPA